MEKEVYKGFTENQLSNAFDMVKNHEHWKGEINAVVDPAKVSVVTAAIEFYAYGFVETTPEGSLVRIYAPGYWGAEALLEE